MFHFFNIKIPHVKRLFRACLLLYFLRATAATAVACFSHRNSVCLSVTRVDQSKTVQARITKFPPSAARKTL